MTFVNSTNNTGMNGHSASYILLTTLLSAGWSCRSSGDGLAAFSTSGSIFTDVGSGSFKFGNGNSWFVVRQPAGGTREFLLQQGSSAGTTDIRFVYSYAGAFTGTNNGAISEKVAPTAFDGIALIGTLANSTAVGSTANLYTTNGTYMYSVRADNASPYGWYALSFYATNSVCGLIFDPLQPGTYPTQDNDPYVIWASNTLGIITSNAAYTDNIRSWYRKGLTGEQFVKTICAPYILNSVNVGASFGTNMWTGGATILPCRFCRHITEGAPSGWKGVSSLVVIVDSGRNLKDTISIAAAGSREYIVGGNYGFVWDGSVPA